VFGMKTARTSLTLALLIALAAPLAAPADAAQWVATWGAAPLPPTAAMGPFPATPGFSNQTIRQVVRVSAGGDRVRVRLTNEYGTRPLTIGAARIALASADGAIDTATTRPLAFAGQPGAVIPAGAPLLSDPVDLQVRPLSSLSISLYLPEDTGPCTCHATGLQTAWVSGKGNFVDTAFPAKETIEVRAFLSGVEVQTDAPAAAIAVLGDSISDGLGSTTNANRRWPDLLAERLAERDGGKAAWGVVNLGISGNRLLDDGAAESALARFDRDVLSLPGVRYLIVFLGVNDLGVSYGEGTGPMADLLKSLRPANPVTADSMIAGYRQLIERARGRGLTIIGATIAPYEGAMYYSARGEAVRRTINDWIRTGKAFDAVLDFDAVIRDPANPARIAAGWHNGDHLHGSDAGYRVLATSIDLSMFR
jgi:lysophospholipase L1-like esterase